MSGQVRKTAFGNLITFIQIYLEAVRIARDNMPRRGKQLAVAFLSSTARGRIRHSHLQKEAAGGEIPF